MFRRVVALGILGGLLWGTTVVPASAVPWTVTQVTTGTVENEYISISGDRIVWQNTHPIPRELWTWKAPAPAPSLICTDIITWLPPKVSGNRVAWIAIDETRYCVYTWLAGETEPSMVTSSAEELDQLEISGDRIVWREGYTHVRTWKVGDTAPTALFVGAFQAAYPQVSGDRVVWQESNGAWQVATWKFGVEPARWVTDDSLSHNYPVVSGDRIAWLGEIPGGGGMAVYTMMATESVPTTVVTGSVPKPDYRQPVLLSGDRVAWLRTPEGGSSGEQVFTWSAGDPVARQISDGTFSQSWLDLSGDRIAWIYGGKVMTWSESEATATVVATQSSVSETVVSGDRIAWRYSFPGVYQIMTAAPPAVLPVATTLRTPTLSPTKPTHNKHAHFSVVLTPGSASMAAGCTKTLRLYQKLSRYVVIRGKRVKQYYWKLRNKATMTGSGTGATQKLSATATPKYAGSWKAIVTYGAGTGFLGCTSPAKTFTVK